MTTTLNPLNLQRTVWLATQAALSALSYSLGLHARAALLVLLPFGWRAWVQARYNHQIYALETVPPARVAIVFQRTRL